MKIEHTKDDCEACDKMTNHSEEDHTNGCTERCNFAPDIRAIEYAKAWIFGGTQGSDEVSCLQSLITTAEAYSALHSMFKGALQANVNLHKKISHMEDKLESYQKDSSQFGVGS